MPEAPPPTAPVPEGRDSAPDSIPAVLARWRTAEIATMEFLNGKGWSLHDVSGQNVGYDLDGIDAEGDPCTSRSRRSTVPMRGSP